MNNILLEKINKLELRVKEKGFKFTPQRQAVLEAIITNGNMHMTVEEIYDYVKKDHSEIGLATVYRSVLLLNDIGIITKLSLNDGIARYQIIHENETHQHHHLICTNCGKIIDVEEDLLDDIESKIEATYGFNVKNHSLKFFGLCKDCRDK
ncbi:Fur family transcriptional regulator [Clostridium neuense]|uniref:Fur family transcriptional regulator n=1 Tax=Clostridium neuense TaxID=1728934 RepID=A0ABW8TGI9_9CLOT